MKVTDRRTAQDFAACMRDLTDTHFPDAEKIRVVMDNLSTHTEAALYETFPAPEARRVLRRLEFHYVPKHASWLNMVEVEIGVLRGQSSISALPSATSLSRKSPPGSASATPKVRELSGCSPAIKLGLRWPRRTHPPSRRQHLDERVIIPVQRH